MSSDNTDVQFPEEVSEPVRAVIAIFQEQLSSLHFPDVDHARLTAMVETVQVQVGELSRARDALAAAQAGLDEQLAELNRMAERAHAYAKIFAQDDDALATRLDAIQLNPRAERKRRGTGAVRKRRAKKTEGLELPLPQKPEPVH